MEPAKKPKSFHEFTPHLADRPPEASADKAPARFAMPSAFWQTLERDSEVKAEFERRVEARAREIIDSENSDQKAKVFEGARAEGRTQGWQEAQVQAQQLLQDLAEVKSKFLTERESLLHSHEKIWCEALVHLMKRFLVPLTPEKLQGLRGWIQESIGEMHKQSKVRVVVAPAVLGRLKESGLALDPDWEWLEDKSLNEKELRVELNGGGLIFSPDCELEKLVTKLNEVFGS